MRADRRSILVGYDDSAAAQAALQWAAESAALQGSSVRALMVDLDESLPPVDRKREPDQEVLARVSAVLTAAGVSGTVERRSGHVVPQLLRAALGADTVVVGSKGHGWAAETVRGSVSQQLARHAPCPVVVVRAAARPDAARIVVGVDGSKQSHAALQFAFRRASLTKESVVALHAWKPGHVDLDRNGRLPSAVGKRSHAAAAALVDYVADLRAEHPDVTLEMDTIALPPAQALTETSADASLIVTGSRGRGVFTGLLLGSVSHHLLHRAQCSVAVVR